MDCERFSNSTLFELKSKLASDQTPETVWTAITAFTNHLIDSDSNLQNCAEIVSKVKNIITKLPGLDSKLNLKSCIQMSSKMFIIYFRVLQTEDIILLFENYCCNDEINDNKYTKEENGLKMALKDLVEYLKERKVSLETDLENVKQLTNKVKEKTKNNQHSNEEFNVTSSKLEYYIHASAIETNMWKRQLQHGKDLIEKCLQTIEEIEKLEESKSFDLNLDSRGIGPLLLFSLIDKAAALISSAIIGTATLLGTYYEQKSRKRKNENAKEIIQRMSTLKSTFIINLEKSENYIKTFNNCIDNCCEVELK